VHKKCSPGHCRHRRWSAAALHAPHQLRHLRRHVYTAYSHYKEASALPFHLCILVLPVLAWIIRSSMWCHKSTVLQIIKQSARSSSPWIHGFDLSRTRRCQIGLKSSEAGSSCSPSPSRTMSASAAALPAPTRVC
jgi:hypothetical protein